MAYITLNKDALAHNYKFLDGVMKERNIEWAPVLKLLCGHREFVKTVLDLGPEVVCDARLTNLKTVKSLNPEVTTVYMKPPPLKSIKNIVAIADITVNTEFKTIKRLSDEAQRQGKTHQVIIMIELGDLREGIMGENLIGFYERVFELPNIVVTGIGANLNCLSGIIPTEDKMIQLSLYGQLIEARFGERIRWVSGGTSVILPLLEQGQVPSGINHYRIGETLFFGNNLLTDKPFPEMRQDVLTLYGEIIEVTKKPMVPIGSMGATPSGEMIDIDPGDYGKRHERAIVDIGLLDVSKPDFIQPVDRELEMVGASSDMMVIDLNRSANKYRIGDIISFRMDYMGALRVMNSRYIDKRIISDTRYSGSSSTR